MRKEFIAAVLTIVCIALAGCGQNGKDGANGKDGVAGKDGAPGKDGRDGAPGKDGRDGIPGKDGMGFRIVTEVGAAKCEPGETLASAMCFIPDGPSTNGVVNFQTPNNAGVPNVLTATCERNMSVRLICAK